MTTACLPAPSDSSSTCGNQSDIELPYNYHDSFGSSSQCGTTVPSNRNPSIDSFTADASLVRFIDDVNEYLSRSGSLKHRYRDRVIDSIRTWHRDHLRIENLLIESVCSPFPGRLDDAIDVLSDHRVNLSAYLHDIGLSSVLGSFSDDAAHILIRAAGRHDDDCLEIVRRAIWSRNESIRESAIESLADIADDRAAEMLKAVVANEKTPHLREMAREYLQERHTE